MEVSALMADDERRAEIEAMARAIYEAMPGKGWTDRVRGGHVAWDDLKDWMRDDWRNAALAALDRVRDARGDDDDPTPAVTPEQVKRANEMGRGGGTMRTRPARSPQGEGHEPKPYAGQPEWRPELGPPDPPTAHMWGVGGAGPGSNRPSPSRDGSVAVEDVLAFIRREERERGDWYSGTVDAIVRGIRREFSPASTGDREGPNPGTGHGG
jgi:hypothetical protein